MAISADQIKKQEEKEKESLHKAIRILEGRIQQLEKHNRSLDALVRRAINEAQRALQTATVANNEVVRVSNVLSRRN